MRVAFLLALTACSGLKPNDLGDTGSTVPESDADADADSDTDTIPTIPGGYHHTITVDGDVSDFVFADEGFSTTGGTTYVAWDPNALYVGVDHPDIGIADGLHWVVITIGAGGAGTSTGAQQGSQTPEVSFPATHVVRFKTDDSYNSLLTWTGAAWSETAFWLPGADHVSNFNTHQSETRIPFSSLGIGVNPFDVHVNFVYEGSGYESSYAPTPAESFVDGYDPDYTRWYSFDPDGNIAPRSYTAQGGGGTTIVDTGTVPVDTADTGIVDTGTVDTGIVDTGIVDTGIVDTGTVDTGTGPTAWSFTATVDADLSEWPAETAFTTSGGQTTWIGWDDATLYLAVQHPDVAGGGPLHWVLAYAGSGTGSTTGVPIGLQTPDLAFAAGSMIRWKADDSYDDLQTWDGAAWVGSSPLFGTGGAARAESGDVVEVAVPFSTLGLGTTFDLYVGMAYEGAPYESTYDATPAGAIAEGSFDPDYVQYWHFDRSAALGPNGYAPSN